MEFFSEIQHPHLDIPALKNLLTIDNLPGLCASISSATPDSDNAGNNRGQTTVSGTDS